MPIEFIHGVGQEPSAWAATMAALPDWVDAAASTIPSVSAPAREPFTLDRAADWVAAELADRTEDDAIVAGLSLGSMVAIRLATREPGLVRGLVLSTPVAKPPRMLMRLQRLALGMASEKRFASATVAEGGTGLTKRDALEVFDHVASVDLRSELTRIQVPTLVLVGENDRANRRLSGKVAELIPDAELRVVPGAAHEWNITHPKRFAEVIMDWTSARGLTEPTEL